MLTRQYWPSLDGLRGLAVLLVIAHNVQLYEPQHANYLGKIAQWLLNIGWVGVTLFFVLSGFLITGILIDSLREHNGVRNFLARRALRIFPLYYGLLLLFFVVLPWLGMQPKSARDDAPYQLWFWLYLGNWASYGIALPHIWSLAVEEQFYLIWPLVVYLARTATQVVVWCIAIALISVSFRWGMRQAGADPTFIYGLTLTRMDALALGSLAAAAWRIESVQNWLRRQGQMLLIAGCTILLVGLATTKNYQRLTPIGQIWGYSALALFFTALVWQSAYIDQMPTGEESKPIWHRFLCWVPLKRVGQYSYGMYIFHKPLNDFVIGPLIQAQIAQISLSAWLSALHVAGVTAITYMLAWVSWHTYEMQFLKLKRHFK